MNADKAVPSYRRVMAEMKVGQPKAQEIRQHLAGILAAGRN
jgi:hypothetical protein